MLEWDYNTLLSARNLQEVVKESRSYVVPVVPRKLPRTVVPGEHFVLKDLPFYEKDSEADAKAWQERLNQREEKRQERTLRKAPGERGQPSSSLVRLPAKKKKEKPTTRVVEVPDSVSASPSIFTPSPLPRVSG